MKYRKTLDYLKNRIEKISRNRKRRRKYNPYNHGLRNARLKNNIPSFEPPKEIELLSRNIALRKKLFTTKHRNVFLLPKIPMKLCA